MAAEKKYKVLVFLVLLTGLQTAFFANGSQDSEIENIIKTGSETEIKSVLKKDEALIDYFTEKDKSNLLHLAVNAGRDSSVIEMLLNFGVSPEYKNSDGITPLMLACRSANQETVRMLLNEYASFSWQKRSAALKKDKNGLTAFDYASERPDIISFLEKQTKYEYKAQKEETEAAAAGGSAAGISAAASDVPAASASAISADTLPATPEAVAAVPALKNSSDQSTENQTAGTRSGEIQEPISLSNAADTRIKKYTPVYLFDVPDETAADSKSTADSIDAILPEDSGTPDKNGCTPLMTAAAAGNLSKMYAVIQNGADVNAADKDGWTAVMFCIRYNGTEAPLKLLTENGADIRKGNNYSITPLILAARYSNDKKVFSMLLKDRSPAENEIRNAFITAVSCEKQTAVLQLFLNMGLSLNQIYTGGKTPLMYAAQNNTETATIGFLQKNGANPKIRSKDGKTAFDYASQNKRLKHDTFYWALNTNGDF